MKLPALKEIVEERKEKAIENLSTSFAKNRLPLEEYERLVEYINKIESERELVVVEKIVREYEAGDEASYGPSDRSADYENDYHNEPEQYQRYSPFTSNNLSVLSSRTISGPLKSDSQFVSILGSMEIKIRKADLSKKRTVLNVVSILGENVIYVERGIQVINNTIPLLGGAWTDSKVNQAARDGEPELVISGAAILGNVTVKPFKDEWN